MIKRVVIFGGHIQALGLARQVNAKGLEVVLIVEDKYQVARFSRALSKTYICPTIEEQLQIIESLELPNRGTMLFPTNDEAVEMLCGRYEEYKERFALGVPEPKVIELFNDKRRAYRFAEASGVHCPKCWYPDTMEDVEAVHLSFDIDGMDPSIVWATGTRVKNGLMQADLEAFIEGLRGLPEMKSMDFVEYNPLLDDEKRTTGKWCMETLRKLIG